MNERELRILRTLVKVLGMIREEIHAVYEDYRAHQDEEQPPPHTNAQVEVRLPPAVNDYYRSEQHDRLNNTRRDRIRLALEGIGLAAALTAGFFAYRSFREVQTQVGIMRQQLEAADRPWIKLVDIEPP